MELKYFTFVLLVTAKFIVMKKKCFYNEIYLNVIQVLGDQTVGHCDSITPLHDMNNIFISGSSLPSAAVSMLSEQQLKLDKPKDTRGSIVNKRKEIKIDLTRVKMTVSLSPDKDEAMASQRMRSSTSQMNGHAGPTKK
jgi:hypothetical protein